MYIYIHTYIYRYIYRYIEYVVTGPSEAAPRATAVWPVHGLGGGSRFKGGLGLRVRRLGLTVEASGFRVKGLGLRVEGSEQNPWFRVRDASRWRPASRVLAESHLAADALCTNVSASEVV